MSGPFANVCPRPDGSHGPHSLVRRDDGLRQSTTCTRCGASWVRNRVRHDRRTNRIIRDDSSPWRVVQKPRKGAAERQREISHTVAYAAYLANLKELLAPRDAPPTPKSTPPEGRQSRYWPGQKYPPLEDE